MGGSTTKLKRWMVGVEAEDFDKETSERAIKRVATPFVYTRKGSMYFDQDGDLAHEFYEEVPSMKKGIKTKMKRIIHGLIPQVVFFTKCSIGLFIISSIIVREFSCHLLFCVE